MQTHDCASGPEINRFPCDGREQWGRTQGSRNTSSTTRLHQEAEKILFLFVTKKFYVNFDEHLFISNHHGLSYHRQGIKSITRRICFLYPLYVGKP